MISTAVENLDGAPEVAHGCGRLRGAEAIEVWPTALSALSAAASNSSAVTGGHSRIDRKEQTESTKND
jgi:hypothetical protein